MVKPPNRNAPSDGPVIALMGSDVSGAGWKPMRRAWGFIVPGG